MRAQTIDAEYIYSGMSSEQSDAYEFSQLEAA